MLATLTFVLSLAAQPPATAAPPTTVPVLEVAGKTTPLQLTADLLRSLPRAEASVAASEHNAAGTFAGVTLRSLLTKAGVPAGHDIRGEYLCWVVTLEAADGYSVVLTLAEVDSDFTDRLVLLADSRDGKALPEKEAPLRLVIPDEKRPARWIRQIVRITAGPACAHRSAG